MVLCPVSLARYRLLLFLVVMLKCSLVMAQTNTHPRVTTEKNINRFREQLKSLGFSYDWDREVSTTDPKYYK